MRQLLTLEDMFNFKGFFTKTLCPIGTECTFTECMFSHEENHAQRVWLNIKEHDEAHESAAKRRKTRPGQRKSSDKTSQSQPFSVSTATKHPTSHQAPPASTESEEGEVSPRQASQPSVNPVDNKSNRLHSSNVQFQVSERPKKPANDSRQQNETLNPRMLKHSPATHGTRLLYLQKLYEGIASINMKARQSEDLDLQNLAMTDQQVIKLALGEEETIAVHSPDLYDNLIRMRLVAWKKTTLEQFKSSRLESLAQDKDTATIAPTNPSLPEGRPIESGLSSQEELLILPNLIADQTGLDAFGFVTTVPSSADIKLAKHAIETSNYWERCDRCTTRFQVFPERKEDGSFTNGGKCIYHYGRASFPERQGQPGALREKIYTCCDESVGVSMGCTVADSHVFKISDPKRLALTMQFLSTPENPHVPENRAVCFDCEMGFTNNGSELIRLTAIAWPTGEELLDVLVRPIGIIIDLNTRYSGVSPKHLADAVPYSANEAKKRASGQANGALRMMIVDSPMSARQLLLNLIGPATPLIGHGIENDLNAIRLVHPTIVDTALLFPHPGGLPKRRALKSLTKQMLWRDIQIQGSQGHDSYEDAKATGDLVRLRVSREWRRMEREGWKLQNGSFIAPKEIPGAPKGPRKRLEAQQLQKRKAAELESSLDYDNA